ncbi:MAG: YceI family protein [Opitutaceae bacterium]|nr:YceI family protein [Cytophagales bacterium]
MSYSICPGYLLYFSQPGFKHLKACFLTVMVFAIGLLNPETSLSQSSYKIFNSGTDQIKLSGTSTLHDWTMASQSVNGQGQFIITNNMIGSITGLNFILQVQNLKSNDNAMDHNAWKALKYEQFPNILYKLKKSQIKPASGNQQSILTLGELTIAGVAKEISMEVTCLVKADKTISCKGSKKLNMTDFQVEPPSFLMGAMKTGNEIELQFDLILKQ